MSAKVVSLHGSPVDDAGVALSVVELLEEKLEAARRGEIVACAVIWVGPSPTDKVGSKCAGDSRHNLVAGTVYLQHELAKD